MIATSRVGRVLVVAVLAAGLGGGLAGCSRSVSKSDVEAQIQSELVKTTPGITGATCPNDLDAKVGATVQCQAKAGEDTIDVVANVTSVEGGTAKFDLLPGIPRTTLASKVEELIGPKVAEASGQQVDKTSCDGPLQPAVGQTQTCKVTVAGEDIPLKTTVTSIENLTINFDINQV